MSFLTSGYVDQKLYKEAHQRYYQKTAMYAPRSWAAWEDELVLAHSIPDRELSMQICRSMAAIQTRRYKLWRLCGFNC